MERNIDCHCNKRQNIVMIVYIFDNKNDLADLELRIYSFKYVKCNLLPISPLINTLKAKLIRTLFSFLISTACSVLDGNNITSLFLTGIYQQLELNKLYSLVVNAI